MILSSRLVTFFVLISLLFVLASSALAHSDITYEQEAGGYQVVLSHFGDAAFAEEEIGFNVFPYPLPNGDVETPKVGKVSVKDENGKEIHTGEFDVADIDAPGFFTYTFPKKGNYVVTLSLTMKDKQLPDANFPIYVYANPMSESQSEPIQETTSPDQGINYWVVGSLVLLVVAAGVFLLKKK
jgi:hypothetical protein